MITSYTTYCPLTTTSAKPTSTVITTHVCTGGECSLGKFTTGVTILTTKIEGAKTTYTTYCPLESELKTFSPSVPSVSSGPSTHSIASTQSAQNSVTSSSAFLTKEAVSTAGPNAISASRISSSSSSTASSASSISTSKVCWCQDCRTFHHWFDHRERWSLSK